MKYDYVLDSYAWAELFDGTEKGKKVKGITDKGSIGTSVITLAEFSDKCARDGRDLEPFLRFIQAKAAILPLDLEIAIKAGKLKKELRKVSNNISLADAIHFQTAKLNKAVFVTGDRDLKNVKDILFLE